MCIMLNLIQISHDMFYDQLNKYICECSDIDVVKVKDMLSKHPCFKEELIPLVYNNNTRLYNTSKHTPKVHVSSPRRRKLLSSSDKLYREIMSLLNKVNESNFSIIKERLLKVCDESNIEIIVNLLLLKCYSQDFYSNVYFKLFDIFPLNLRDIISLLLEKFVNHIRDNTENDLQTIIQTSIEQEKYDKYCDLIKQKRIFTQKHKTILLLEQHKWVKLDVDEYLKDIFLLMTTTRDSLILDVLMKLCSVISGICGTNQTFTSAILSFRNPNVNMCSKTTFLLRELQEPGNKKMKYKA